MNHTSLTKASITTARIEVQVLTLDDRQMTMSVFRQLPSAGEKGRLPISLFPLIDPGDAKTKPCLQAVPWGWVNYHWKDCGRGDHRHVVALDGERLYQHVVSMDWLTHPVGPHHAKLYTSARAVVTQYVMALEIQGVQVAAYNGSPERYTHFDVEFSGFRVQLAKEPITKWRASQEIIAKCDGGSPILDRARETQQAIAATFRAQYPESPETYKMFLRDTLADLHEYEQDWEQHVAAPLRALPQLFIAV